MVGTGYSVKSQKIIPSEKNQSVLTAKHKESPIRKNKLPQKFRATRHLGNPSLNTDMCAN